MKKIFITLITLLIVSFRPLSAQINFSKVSVDIWVKQNYKTYHFDNTNQFLFYPELQIGGKFIHDYLEWNINGGYWNDGIDEPFPVMDHMTYTYSSIIVGGYISFYPEKLSEKFIFPIHLLTGFSHHFISEKYVGGEDFTGSHRNNNFFGLFTIDLGLGVNFNLIDRIRIRLEGIVYFPLDKNQYTENYGSSSSFKIGFDYMFN